MELSFQTIRQSLRDTGFGGVSVLPGTFPSLYAIAASGAGATLNDGNVPAEWAVISYVQTNSPTEGVGGMPAYVATEVEDVLDALVATGILKNRALYWEAIGSGRDGAEAARALHCIGCPIICVPPTRTREYSRYQRPDRWDVNTHLALVSFENILRNCETCSRLCPDEWDIRLLNIAATLQTWPIADAMLGSVGRGAFVSFESFDRYAYTIEWLLVLLHLALESGDYVASLIEKSIQLYGQPLFRPCGRCVQTGKEVHTRSGIHPHLKLLEGTFQFLDTSEPIASNHSLVFALLECISQLVAQVSRFTLTRSGDRATNKLTSYLWTLDGLQRTHGENALWRYIKNETRLEVLAKRIGASTADLRLIAAGMLRGRPSEGSCVRHADKWTTALVCANPVAICDAFLASASQRTLCKRTYSKVVRDVLQYGAFAFGSLIPFNTRYATHLHPEIRKCKRAPKCTGSEQFCLFSEHSGIVPPTASVRFLRDCFLTPQEIANVANDNLQKISNGVVFARVCYLSGWRFSAGKEVCCACQPARRALNESRRLILIAWDPTFRHALPMKPRASSSTESPEKRPRNPVCETPVKSSSYQQEQSEQLSGRKTPRSESEDEDDSERKKRPRTDQNLKSASSAVKTTQPKIEEESSPKQTPLKNLDTETDAKILASNTDVPAEKSVDSPRENPAKQRVQLDSKDEKTTVPNATAEPDVEIEVAGTSKTKSNEEERVTEKQATKSTNEAEKIIEPSTKSNAEKEATQSEFTKAGIERKANLAHRTERRTFTPEGGLLPPYASPVLSYIVVDALNMGHVLVSGVDTVVRAPPATTMCTVCGGSMTVLDVELSDETLEIHNDQLVNTKQAAAGLVAGIKTAHELYAMRRK